MVTLCWRWLRMLQQWHEERSEPERSRVQIIAALFARETAPTKVRPFLNLHVSRDRHRKVA